MYKTDTRAYTSSFDLRGLSYQITNVDIATRTEFYLVLTRTILYPPLCWYLCVGLDHNGTKYYISCEGKNHSYARYISGIARAYTLLYVCEWKSPSRA